MFAGTRSEEKCILLDENLVNLLCGPQKMVVDENEEGMKLGQETAHF